MHIFVFCLMFFDWYLLLSVISSIDAEGVSCALLVPVLHMGRV